MARTWQNPVYPHACPDPFAFRHDGSFWCISSGKRFQGDEEWAYPVLRSPNLVDWEQVSYALPLLGADYPECWAPEMYQMDGRFYLYHSVGNEETMQIRVAVADSPVGPFVDMGGLTTEPFAIDAHIFTDDDGSRWCFYAVDFFDGRIGTGIVMDRLLDPLTLAGRPRVVARAEHDWQVYDPARKEKGGVKWHTVEGPFVLKQHGRYYMTFSGGNWTNESYGVAYAVTDSLESSEPWHQPVDGVNQLPLLRTDREQGVIGPGHNSAVLGPDGRTLYCVYHRWDPVQRVRVMAIDRLGWEGDRLVVHGPTTTPQPMP
jgi:GH43 family beta-xylosidase